MYVDPSWGFTSCVCTGKRTGLPLLMSREWGGKFVSSVCLSCLTAFAWDTFFTSRCPVHLIFKTSRIIAGWHIIFLYCCLWCCIVLSMFLFDSASQHFASLFFLFMAYWFQSAVNQQHLVACIFRLGTCDFNTSQWSSMLFVYFNISCFAFLRRLSR